MVWILSTSGAVTSGPPGTRRTFSTGRGVPQGMLKKFRACPMSPEEKTPARLGLFASEITNKQAATQTSYHISSAPMSALRCTANDEPCLTRGGRCRSHQCQARDCMTRLSSSRGKWTSDRTVLGPPQQRGAMGPSASAGRHAGDWMPTLSNSHSGDTAANAATPEHGSYSCIDVRAPALTSRRVRLGLPHQSDET